MNKFVSVTTLITNISILALLCILYLQLNPSIDDSAESVETATAEEENLNQDDMEKLRSELKEKWGNTGFGDVKKIIEEGENILSKEYSLQTIEELKKISKKANAAANYVGYIEEEYSDYKRANYQYDFVTKKVEASLDKYIKISNKLKSIRNESYFILGMKHKDMGLNGEAFFYFRDAFRLDSFSSYESKKNTGMRYKAEQEMKKLIGLDDIASFKSWK